MPKRLIGNKEIAYKIKKHRLKDFSIKIHDKKIIVYVPHKTTQVKIDKYMTQHSDWIRNRIKSDNTYILSGTITYLGTAYNLETVVGDYKNPHLTCEGDQFILYTYKESRGILNHSVDEWLKIQTERIVHEKINKYKKIISVEPKKIFVEKLFLRWGSCSNFGNMKFHVRCAMLPDEIINYVVVHELCHLIQLNHSQDFWKEVKRVIPDFESRQSWLDEEGIKYIR